MRPLKKAAERIYRLCLLATSPSRPPPSGGGVVPAASLPLSGRTVAAAYMLGYTPTNANPAIRISALDMLTAFHRIVERGGEPFSFARALQTEAAAEGGGAPSIRIMVPLMATYAADLHRMQGNARVERMLQMQAELRGLVRGVRAAIAANMPVDAARIQQVCITLMEEFGRSALTEMDPHGFNHTLAPGQIDSLRTLLRLRDTIAASLQ